MKDSYRRIIEAVLQSPWAIIPGELEVIVSKYLTLRQPNFEARKIGPSSRHVRNIAVLPLYGILVHRADVMTYFSGGTSTLEFARMFRRAMADPSVAAVVIEIDSPGGSVYGCDELASEIHDARGRKKICAISNSQMAAAAYWIGSAADAVSCTPGGEIGSIGVIGAHTDESKAMEAAGLAITLISAGKFKTEGNPYEPLGVNARAAMQHRVDQYYGQFVKAVASNRGVSQTAVRAGYGQGRMLGAAEAMRAGMIDHVETLDQMLMRIAH